MPTTKLQTNQETRVIEKGIPLREIKNSKLETIFKCLTKTNIDEKPDLFLWQCTSMIYVISLKSCTMQDTDQQCDKEKMTTENQND